MANDVFEKGSVRAARPSEARSAVRCVRTLARIVESMLPDQLPSWQRVALRQLHGECTALLGETITMSDVDAAQLVAEEDGHAQED